MSEKNWKQNAENNYAKLLKIQFQKQNNLTHSGLNKISQKNCKKNLEKLWTKYNNGKWTT